MNIKTHIKKIEMYFMAIPLFLFFLYLFIANTAFLLVVYYYFSVSIILFLGSKAINLIEKTEGVSLIRLKKYYKICLSILAVVGAITVIATTFYLNMDPGV